jgi:hypothetical protein
MLFSLAPSSTPTLFAKLTTAVLALFAAALLLSASAFAEASSPAQAHLLPTHVRGAREPPAAHSAAPDGYPFWWHEVPLSSAQQPALDDLPRACTASTVVNDTCTLHPLEVRPTQFTLGQTEVECRAAHISRLSDQQLCAYLRERPVPLVRGPQGDFFLVDRHHLACALLASPLPDAVKLLQCVLVLDYSQLPAELFWPKMMADNLAFVESPSSRSLVLPAFLPHHIDELQNDPYRSLAYWVRKNGGYGKSTIPYQDARWATFFRARVPLTNLQASQLLAGVDFNWCTFSPYDQLCLPNQLEWIQQNMDLALQLSRSASAAGLPGWGAGGSAVGVSC